MELLRGALRTYAWGSRTAIAEFTGRPVPAAHPEAELWFGAHPGDPAWLQTPHGQTSLLEALVADPEGQLGSASRARFGDVLPFLVKVLAADEPLSLQAHPSAEQAVEGYLREERMGIPVSSPVRNYRDTSHKPELLVALQPFEALAGFREAARTTELLRALAVSDLDPFIDLLSEGSDADGLRALFTTWITAPQPDIDVLVPAVLDGAIQYVSSGATEFGAEAKTVLELGERYPGDAGVLAALLLNRISLAPGEAIFLPAGNLHAYVRGFGVEVMANSDNVLRGGLTPKHVDVPELLRVLDFAPTPKARLRPPIRREGLGLVFETPTDEFAATLLVLDGDHLGHEVDASSGHDGPQILLYIYGCCPTPPTSLPMLFETDSARVVRGPIGWRPRVAENLGCQEPAHVLARRGCGPRYQGLRRTRAGRRRDRRVAGYRSRRRIRAVDADRGCATSGDRSRHAGQFAVAGRRVRGRGDRAGPRRGASWFGVHRSALFRLGAVGLPGSDVHREPQPGGIQRHQDVSGRRQTSRSRYRADRHP